MTTNVQFVRKSSNAKIGAIPCTTSPRVTCPDACPMKGDTACYAEGGYYTRTNWNKVDSGERGDTWEALLSSVQRLPEGQLWRHNVAGDLQGTDDVINRDALVALTEANAGRRGFTYTHYPHTLDNIAAIKEANEGGFTVNLSANSPAQAEQARAHGVPVVTLVPNEDWWQGDHKRTQGDAVVVRCPAETGDDVTCESCRLCSVSTRSTVVGFTAHGAGKKKTEVIASAS